MPSAESKVDVYAVFGADPEVQAYAMAKYSRSSLSMKESLKEISQQKAEKFLNTFYFQYGHRSIADLAHIALAIERLSILAAIAVSDEQRWDGQERSTRYQDFNKSGYYRPDFGSDDVARQIYKENIVTLFSEYQALSQGMFDYLCDVTPRPPEMKQEAYERTLRARAFDVSRYMLPLATNTSLGEIVNARTLEMQVSHLMAHTHAEVRHLGELLKQAATSPAYNVHVDSLRDLVEQIRETSPSLADRAEKELIREIRVAPTLVKYADPNVYEKESRRELRQAAGELMGRAPTASAKLVDLLDDDPLEVELAATLLYEHSHYSYRQIRQSVQAAGEKMRREYIDIGLRHRGKHDEPARAFRSGQQFRFDILMDIGGFRDMHRHRRCIQIGQDFTTKHGYDVPAEVASAGVRHDYEASMRRTSESAEKLSQHLLEGQSPVLDDEERSWLKRADRGAGYLASVAQYMIPLGFRKRTLFKMDFAEVVYISELRTGAAGHISYRNVAYAMYEAVRRKYPELAKYFRIVDVREPVDLLKR